MAEERGKFPNFLGWALGESGVQPADLARSVETAPQNVYRFVNGERELTKGWAEKFSRHLPGIRAAELIFGPEGTHSLQRVPLYTTIQAGRFAEVQTVIEEQEPERVVVEDLPEGDWLAFEVLGDSMNRVAPEGAIVFVNRRERELTHGRYYAVAVKNEATFKQFKTRPPRLEPASSNPVHETIFLEEEGEVVRVIGRVHRVVNNL